MRTLSTTRDGVRTGQAPITRLIKGGGGGGDRGTGVLGHAHAHTGRQFLISVTPGRTDQIRISYTGMHEQLAEI